MTASSSRDLNTFPSHRYWILLLLVALLPSHLVGDDGFCRPDYEILRFDEDWSCLAGQDPCASCDFWDPYKYIPIDSCGRLWLSFGGHTRMRFEDWSNFEFEALSDDSFLLSRLFLHADVHWSHYLRGFVEFKTAHCTSRDLAGERRTLDVDVMDVQNLFVDLSTGLKDCMHATLRVGRQELLFGRERLVSPNTWSNTQRSFEGVSLIVDGDCWRTHAFYTEAVQVRKYRANQTSVGEFYGLYFSRSPEEDYCTDLYWFARDREDVTHNDLSATEKRHTIGARVERGVPCTSFDYELELAQQFGESGPGEICALMISAELGYSAALLGWEGRAHLGFDWASGDKLAGNNDIETFCQLFPDSHFHLGYIDIIGRQNNTALNLGIEVSPYCYPGLCLLIHSHCFWREHEHDGLYNSEGTVIRAGNLSNTLPIGTELDLLAQYRLNSHVLFIAGYSRFTAANFIDRSNPLASSDIHFSYLSAQYTF